ncbi:hypothetical protein DL96DRAFT_1613352, partial [Flagelloscypha sp. PMI_526]
MGIPPPLCDLSIPSLRRITFTRGDDDDPMFFSAPLFHMITHLELSAFDSSDWPSLWISGIPSMTSLTHLVLDTTPSSDLQGHLLMRLPSSVRLILLRIDSNPATTSSSVHDDPRIVYFTSEIGTETDEIPFLSVFSDGFDVWTGKLSEEETFWAEGERLLLEKQRLKLEKLA